MANRSSPAAPIRGPGVLAGSLLEGGAHQCRVSAASDFKRAGSMFSRIKAVLDPDIVLLLSSALLALVLLFCGSKKSLATGVPIAGVLLLTAQVRR